MLTGSGWGSNILLRVATAGAMASKTRSVGPWWRYNHLWAWAQMLLCYQSPVFLLWIKRKTQTQHWLPAEKSQVLAGLEYWLWNWWMCLSLPVCYSLQHSCGFSFICIWCALFATSLMFKCLFLSCQGNFKYLTLNPWPCVCVCNSTDCDICQLQVRQSQPQSRTRKTPTNHSHLLPSFSSAPHNILSSPKLLWLVSNSPFHWSFQLQCVSAHSAATTPYIFPL